MVANHRPDHYAALVGDMYAWWVLDVLIELAYHVSVDFVARPNAYKQSDIPDAIVDLRSAYGYARNYPNKIQREELNVPIFGASDSYATGSATDAFRSARQPLFDACTKYEERTINDAPSGLRASIYLAMEQFPAHLRAFEGPSITSSYHQMHALSDLSYTILRSPGITSVFGIPTPPQHNWPVQVEDANGAYLVQKVNGDAHLTVPGVIQFSFLRLVAQQGRHAIERILAPDATNEEHLEDLAKSVYTWARATEQYAVSLKA